MPAAWGGQDIDREKTVFVWPSGTARAEKTDMINVTFTPGMTEKQVKTLLSREFDLDWCTAPVTALSAHPVALVCSDADDIVGLVDGYNQLCECLGDIAGNRKGKQRNHSEPPFTGWGGCRISHTVPRRAFSGTQSGARQCSPLTLCYAEPSSPMLAHRGCAAVLVVPVTDI